MLLFIEYYSVCTCYTLFIHSLVNEYLNYFQFYVIVSIKILYKSAQFFLMDVHILCCILRDGISYCCHMFLSWCSSKEACGLDPTSDILLSALSWAHHSQLWAESLYTISSTGFGFFPNPPVKTVKVPYCIPIFPVCFFFFSSISSLLQSSERKANGSPFGWLPPDLTLLGVCWHTVGPPVLFKVPPEKEIQQEVQVYVYYKLLTHVMMEAEHSYDLPSVAEIQKVGGMLPKAWEPDGWYWRWGLKFEALSTKSAESRRSMSLLNLKPHPAPPFFCIWALCGLGVSTHIEEIECALLTVFSPIVWLRCVQEGS